MLVRKTHNSDILTLHAVTCALAYMYNKQKLALVSYVLTGKLKKDYYKK